MFEVNVGLMIKSFQVHLIRSADLSTHPGISETHIIGNIGMNTNFHMCGTFLLYLHHLMLVNVKLYVTELHYKIADFIGFVHFQLFS